jgi:hypothetical protein
LKNENEYKKICIAMQKEKELLKLDMEPKREVKKRITALQRQLDRFHFKAAGDNGVIVEASRVAIECPFCGWGLFWERIDDEGNYDSSWRQKARNKKSKNNCCPKKNVLVQQRKSCGFEERPIYLQDLFSQKDRWG